MLLSIHPLSQSVAHNPFSVPLSAPVSYDPPEPCKSLTTWHQSTYQCCSLYISCPNQWLTIPVSVPLSAPVSYDSPEPCKPSPLDINIHANAAFFTSPAPISGSQSLFLCLSQLWCYMTPLSHVNPHHLTPFHTPLVTNTALFTSPVAIDGPQSLSLCPCQLQCHMTP